MLHSKLKRLIKFGHLTVIGPSGRKMAFGPSVYEGPDVAIRITGRLTSLKLALHPDLYLGEAYMNGALIVERGTLWDLLELCGRNLEPEQMRPLDRVSRMANALIRVATQHNARRAAKQNVAHHYDLSNDMYRLFLDDDLQYSCAYFQHPALSLADAQRAKKRLIARKLQLAPGQRVLDIGCGWGGLALSLARTEDIRVLGITLSPEQLKVARQRAEELGLTQRVTFELLDYRDVKGTFDRVVSVGMFEHVGAPNYDRFFFDLSRLLTPDGLALIHSIGRMRGPSTTSSWIRRYIFPGGYIPALSQVLPSIEQAGLWLTDLEVLRLHYADTLRAWRERFMHQRDVAAAIYDERFCRMWEFYLAVSEMSFRYGGFMVFQAQLARRVDAVPLTRDYLFDGCGRAGQLDQFEGARAAAVAD